MMDPKSYQFRALAISAFSPELLGYSGSEGEETTRANIRFISLIELMRKNCERQKPHIQQSVLS
jgi:hypothetical protein